MKKIHKGTNNSFYKMPFSSFKKVCDFAGTKKLNGEEKGGQVNK